MSEAIDYGFGLFETIRFQNGKAQDLKRHFDRLKSSADELGIAFKQSQVTFEEDVNTAVSKSEIEVGALRYQLSKKMARQEMSIFKFDRVAILLLCTRLGLE